ncbi:2,3-diaminopropionate biosynthesis protein SbnB [Streptomyces sp. E5N91]|uniref:2,3-diaminopropionate biosynthesis protein SbnB n=1 Tax=Streptomyces sp. E5N91 TaxID=1851996 RepID=UPI000EF59786
MVASERELIDLPAFRIVNRAFVRKIIDAHLPEIRGVVRDAYIRYADGLSVNPLSGFLRFPDRPRDRIIALPARDRGEGADHAGIKWISSFPENIEKGLPRASAIVILNEMETGLPVACLEGSAISAARTAASATLAAGALHPRKDGQVLGIIGCGPIAKTVYQHLRADGWFFRYVTTFDLDEKRAHEFGASLDGEDDVRIAGSVAEVADAADLIVFATTAREPHFSDAHHITPRHTVLHLSLRDLGTEILLGAQNIVDDPEHAVREGTSVGFAVAEHGDTEIIAGTLAQILTGTVAVDHERPRIFSPFGLGVLDIAVASYVYDSAAASGQGTEVLDFFADSA